MTFHAAVVQAPHASRHNGGGGADDRQYFARKTQRTTNGPRIASAVAGMAPGDFVTVWANNANNIFRVYNAEVASGTDDILDWTPFGVWDAPTEQVLIGGRRGQTKLIAFAELVGDWREQQMPADMGRLISGTVHYYGRIARNPLTGVVYYGSSETNGKLWAYTPSTEGYERLADTPAASGGNGASFEWLADTEKLVCYAGDAQRWMVYTPGTDSWETLATGVGVVGHGQHNLLRYHATHQRCLLLGGTGTSLRASLVTSAGVATQVTDMPDTLGYSNGAWAIPHSSGAWLVKLMGTTPKLYAVWPNETLDDVTWEDLGAAPDAALTYSTLIPGYSSDIALIVSTSGLHAWRLPTLEAPGSHTASGALVGGGAAVTGSASRSGAAVSHSASGVLVAGGATIDGASTLLRLHTASGVLAGSGAAVDGAALHLRTHSASGALSAAGAVVDGSASRSGVAVPTITVRVLDKAEAGSPLAGSTGWDCYWYDDATTMAEAVATTPTVSLTGQSADSLGRLVLTLSGSTKSSGEYGFLMFSNGDGSTDQSPPPRSFAALVPVD